MDYLQHLWDSAHPLITHFPIALLSLAAILCWVGLKKDNVYKHVWLLQAVGSMLLIPSTLFGLRDGNKFEDTSLHELIEPHEKFGLITTGYFIIVTAWLYKSLKSDKSVIKGKYQLLLITIGFILLMITGYLGGQLVHKTGIRAN